MMCIKKVLVSALMIAGVAATAQAEKLTASDGSIETSLCMAAANGNRAVMHNQIKASGYSAKFVAKNIACNGENILAFVEKHGKRSEVMINMIERGEQQVSITDIAQHQAQK
ncbi:DUF3718 domain-containing protein [Thalassotalea sp. 1_MG-2023]|uniref:DUF3718 domain-containing protein n=1 Tax=Thalassotalea sp. 1_MG-2023 TaxID=3062680 RepID=UPI0026E292F2|nr:DUF3718 domain-containing protein [Thalassotalea sp. 1_MG-2023]MDO6425902.1 DUF3718 domain-containing protein [Thalassotalea sp. 1_MG-2023]